MRIILRAEWMRLLLRDMQMRIPVDKIVNAALLAAAVAVLAVAWKNNHPSWVTPPFRADDAKIQHVIGKTTKPSMIMILSTDCHFCSESTPFYQKLAASPSIQRGDVDLIAVLPQDSEDVERYLTNSKLSVSRVVSKAPFSDLGGPGTPTLIMLRDGKVQNTWEGKLGNKEAEEVLHLVNR